MSRQVGPLLTVVQEADHHTADLFDKGKLAAVVSALIEVAESHGIQAVLGASPAGERLAGAMLLEAQDLHGWRPGESAVLIVDGVVVTDLGVRTRALRALALGAEVAHGAVVGLTGSPNDSDVGPLSSLVVLHDRERNQN